MKELLLQYKEIVTLDFQKAEYIQLVKKYINILGLSDIKSISITLDFFESVDNIDEFIDQLFINNSKNKILMELFSNLEKDEIDSINNYLRDKENRSYLQEVLVWAVLLNQLTLELEGDNEVTEKIYNQLKKKIKDEKIIRYVNIALQLKYWAVEIAYNTLISGRYNTKNINRNWLSKRVFESKVWWILHWNILIVAVYEIINTSFANGLVGIGLSIRQIINIWATKKNIFEEFIGGDHWIDLYQSWDMTLLARHENSLFSIIKLIIPAVADYHDDRGRYLQSRTISLFIFMNMSCHFKRLRKVANLEVRPTPIPRKFVRKWGGLNLKKLNSPKKLGISAKSYF